MSHETCSVAPPTEPHVVLTVRNRQRWRRMAQAARPMPVREPVLLDRARSIARKRRFGRVATSRTP